jgi:hypothetical protein
MWYSISVPDHWGHVDISTLNVITTMCNRKYAWICLFTDPGRERRILNAMTRGRDNAAESLSDLLQLIRFGRHSGLLSVERIQRGHIEEAEVYVQKGQPIYIRTGNTTGQEALTQLLTWRQVHFSFILGAVPPSGPSSQQSTSPVTPGEVPAMPSTGPLSPSRPVNTTEPLPRSAQLPDGNIPLQPLPISQPGHAATGEHAYGQESPAGYESVPHSPMETLIPKKSGESQDVLSLPLTRPQRSIYLLVNGQRTIADLARMTRKSIPEVGRLLSELRERGLISI